MGFHELMSDPAHARMAFLVLVGINTMLVGLSLFFARTWFLKVETHMAHVEHSLEALAVLNVRVERIEKDMARIFEKVFV